MPHGLAALNEHLFSQLDRLRCVETKGEQLKEEIERAKAVSSIAKDIAANAKLQKDSYHMLLEYGRATGSPPDILGISHASKKT